MTRIRVLLAVVVILAIAGAFTGWKMLAGRESTDDAKVDGHVYPVSARIAGTVEVIEVVENQPVEAGAILVRLDDRNYRLALSKAEADLASATAHHREIQTQLPTSSVGASARTLSSDAVLMHSQSGVQTAQKDLEAARARVETVRARLRESQLRTEKAARDLQRLKPLMDKDEISRQQYDTFVATADSARAAETSAQAEVIEAEKGVALSEARLIEAKGAVRIAESGVEAATVGKEEVKASEARISVASADVERSRSAVEQAKLDLEHVVVRAPVAGIVSRRNVQKGSVIQSGQPLMAIVPLSDVWVTANFKENQLDHIRPGQTAEIKVDAYGGVKLTARVDSIASATGATFSLLPAENASGNFVKVVQRVPVKLVITDKVDARHTLRPGMSVEVTVLTDEHKN